MVLAYIVSSSRLPDHDGEKFPRPTILNPHGIEGLPRAVQGTTLYLKEHLLLSLLAVFLIMNTFAIIVPSAKI